MGAKVSVPTARRCRLDRLRRWVAAGLLLLVATGAGAQDATDGATDAETADSPANENPAETGDLPSESDERPRTVRSLPLAETGGGPAIDLSIAYTFDVWHVARGGLRSGWRYLDNLDVTLRADLERAAGWDGATFFVYGLYNDGQGFSEELVGDAQGVSNIETPTAAVRLYEAWLEQRFAGDRASLKAGLYDLNSEFDTNDTGGLFINSSHGIGPDFAQSGRNGPSIFPVTSLALRADYRLSDSWLVRAAILDGVPGDPDHPRRTAILLGEGDGALLVGEVEFRTERTKLAAGYWTYTAAFDEVGPPPASAPPARRTGNDGAYLLVERRLAQFGSSETSGLAGWARVGLAEDDFNPVDLYVGGGLVVTGAAAGRPGDQFGVAIGSVRFGEPYRRGLEASGERSTRSEVNFEASYRAMLAPWLSVQPDLQYVVNPGGRPDLPDALVVGVRVTLAFQPFR